MLVMISANTTALTKVMTTTLRNIMASTNLEGGSSVTYCFDEHSCQGRTKKSSNALVEQIFRHSLHKMLKTNADLLPFNYHLFFIYGHGLGHDHVHGF